MEISTLAKLLKPYIYSYIEETLTATSIGASGSSTDIAAAFNAHVADTNIHHNRQHSIISPTDHTVVGNPLDLVGLVNTNQLGIIVPSSNPGSASAILRTDSSGYVAVKKLSTNTIDTISGNITINPAGAGVVYISADVGIGKSSPDYALDIVGTAQISTKVISPLFEYGSANLAIDSDSFLMTGIDFDIDLTGSVGIFTAQTESIAFDSTEVTGIDNVYNIGVNKTASADYIWLGYSSSVGLRQFVDGNTVIQTKLTVGASEPDESYNLSVTGLTYSSTGFTTTGYLIANTSVKTNYLYDADDITIGSTSGSVRLEDDKAFLTETFDSSFPQTGFRIGPTSISGQYSVSAGVGLFDELRVRIFVADETRVDRGNQYWTKSFGIVAEQFITPSSIGGTVTVKFEDSPALSGAIFSANDWILIQSLDIDTGIVLSSIWGQVTSYSDLSGADEGNQSWTFTLRNGPTNETVRKGQSVIDFGSTGAALIHLSTVDPNGAPYIKMRRWAGSDPFTPANYITYLQIGELDSISNPNYSPSGFGIYIRSELGADQFVVADDNGIRLQNLAIKAFSTNQTVDISSTGNLKLGTDISVSATTSFDFTASSGALRVGFVGANKPNLYFNGTNLYLRINTTNFISFLSTGSAYFSGVINIGSSGGIYQGSGTFASPTTGIKIYNSSGIGKLASFNSGTVQITVDTDGYLYAGGGNVWLNEDGINIAVEPAATQPSYLAFVDPSNNVKASIGYYYTAGPIPASTDGLIYYGLRHRFFGAVETNSALSIGGAFDLNSNDILNATALGVNVSSFDNGIAIDAVKNTTANAIRARTLGGGVSIQALVDSGTSYSRGGLFHNAIWDQDSALWNIAAIGANDTSAILWGNGSTFNFIIHSSTGNTARTMSHATFTGGSKMTLNTSTLGLSVDLDLNGNDLQDIGLMQENMSGLSFGSGWTNYNTSIWNPGRRKHFGDMVVLSGMVARTSGTGTTIATLPVGYRPTKNELFAVQTSSGLGRVDVYDDGTVVYVSGGTTWISLAGLIFSTT